MIYMVPGKLDAATKEGNQIFILPATQINKCESWNCKSTRKLHKCFRTLGEGGAFGKDSKIQEKLRKYCKTKQKLPK